MFIHLTDIRQGRKGQLVSVMTIFLIAFLIAAFVAVNAGKIRLQTQRLHNAAESAALAGGSAACVLLNILTNLNNSLLMNYASFGVMMFILLLSLLWDFVSVLIAVAKAIADKSEWGQSFLIAGIGLACTVSTIAMQAVAGSIIAGTIADEMHVLNAEAAKASRNTARSFAFMNAGVDEPKITFHRFKEEGLGTTWEEYQNLENGFDIFMRRTLPEENMLPDIEREDLDISDFPPSTVDYSWEELRGTGSSEGMVVENTVSVTVDPFFGLGFEELTLEKLADDFLIRQDIKEMIRNSDMKKGMKVLVGDIALDLSKEIMGTIKAVRIALPQFGIVCAAAAIAYIVLAIGSIPNFGEVLRCVIIAACMVFLSILQFWMFAEMNRVKPEKMVVAMREDPYSVVIMRTEIERRRLGPDGTSDINYGLYTTEHPGIREEAYVRFIRDTSGVTGGSLMPPQPGWDVELFEFP